VKIALLGATGFIGYTFFRLLRDRGISTIVVYCNGASRLTNLTRHDVDLRFVPYGNFSNEKLDGDTKFLINFSHPFTKRDGLETHQQADILTDFISRNCMSLPDLKLIHISTLSVYEPFGRNRVFGEDEQLKPPSGDTYAMNKVHIEKRLVKEIDAGALRMLRPTMVFGPFCGPWTDSIMSSVDAGDSLYKDLGGKFQPVWVGDVCRFLFERISDYRPGTFNFGGPERMSWHEFLKYFSDIVDRGELFKLVRNGSTNPVNSPEMGRAVTSKLIRKLYRIVPAVVRDKIRRSMPPEIDSYVQRKLGRKAPQNLGKTASSSGQYLRDFFSEDRLVSMKYFEKEFGTFQFTRLAETADIMKAYYLYRYSDNPVVFVADGTKIRTVA
jgi:nucleoside-diphosphate-sugar epimerase